MLKIITAGVITSLALEYLVKSGELSKWYSLFGKIHQIFVKNSQRRNTKIKNLLRKCNKCGEKA